MGKMTTKKRLSMSVLLVSVGVLLSGTKACQEDYDLGSRTQAQPTSTPTSTSTSTPDPDETEEPTPTASSIPTVSATVSTGAASVAGGSAFLSALAGIGVVESENYYGGKEAGDAASGAPLDGAESGNVRARIGENWLGRSFLGEESVSDRAGSVEDADDDGYTDTLEESSGTDRNDQYSQPRPGASVLMNRFRGLDDDYDGLSNDDEVSLGSDPFKADTDGDGARDGAEYASKSDLLDSAAMPEDSDGDGLSDEYENLVGTNPASPDTDGDRLPDGVEIAINTQPRVPDTDGDGALDGREYQSGADPTVKDYR